MAKVWYKKWNNHPGNDQKKIVRKNLLFLIIIAFFSTLPAQNEIEITENVPFYYVYMEFKDFNYFEDFHECLPQFMQEIGSQGLSSHIKEALYAMLFNSPIQKTKLNTIMALGFQISKEIFVKPPLKKGQFDYKKIVKVIHAGYFGQIYNIIGPYIEEENLEVIGPLLLKIIDKPTQGRPDLLRAELIAPVQIKKGQNTGNRS